MDDVVICSPLRTPVGRFGGVFAGLSANELAATALRGLAERTGLAEGEVDDVILGNCSPSGENPAIGRIAALDAGLGVQVPGLQIDRRCGSALQAVIDAAMRVQTGAADLVIAGGAESMSQAEHYMLGARFGVRGDSTPMWCRISRGRITSGGKNHPVAGGMLETAENVRREYKVDRLEQDAWALRSQQAAGAAIREGRFADEIIGVEVAATRKTPARLVTEDEHPRPETTMEDLAKLRPVMGRVDPEATVTAGNASGQNDGAAVCLVTTRAEAERRGWEPMVRLVGWSVAGVPPETMGIGPVPATAAVLEQTGLKLSDMDLIELNEAFASQVLACLSEWGLGSGDRDRVNVNGSGISLGHPVGATGARILATLAHEMRRREARYGLETMCIGGGQGLAAVFERVV